MSDAPFGSLTAWAIIPKVGGAFSLIGSTLILRDIGRKWANVPLTTEVLAHITVANTVIAFWECFLSTWMVPAGSSAYMATGNTTTCNVQGFISVVAFIVLELSYTILSVLYWIMVAQGWTEQKTERRKIRFLFLVLPLVIGIAFATPLLFNKAYNFTGAYSCNIEEYPLHCDISGVECTRGANARELQGGMFIVVALCSVVILIFMTLLVRTVRTHERKTDKYLTIGQEKRREMSDRAFWSAVRYISVFFVSNLPFYIYAFFDITREFAPIAITYLYVIIWPMFGVFNSFAYFRPKYLSYRAKNPDKSLIFCLCIVLDIDLGSWLSRSDESVPPSVAELIDDDDLGSPLFQEEAGFSGRSTL